MEHDPRRFGTLEDGCLGAVLEHVGRVVRAAVAVRDMGVEVDQPRQHPARRPVERIAPFLPAPRADRGDLAAAQHDQPVIFD